MLFCFESTIDLDDPEARRRLCNTQSQGFKKLCILFIVFE